MTHRTPARAIGPRKRLTVVWGWSSMVPGMEKRPVQPWEILNNEEVFVAAPWIKLSVQRLRLPNGRVVEDYYQVELSDFVVIFAQTMDGKVVMERLYKHGVGKVTLILPSGVIEHGEEPSAAARRELLEETGYISNHWESLGSLVANGNYGCGKAHLFIARKARRVAEPKSGDLEDMEIVLMELEDVVDAFHEGDVSLLSTVATIALSTNPLFVHMAGSRLANP